MADINVERRGPSIWPWIIGLIVLALLIWAIAEMVDTRDRGVTAPVAEEVAPVTEPVQPIEPAQPAEPAPQPAPEAEPAAPPAPGY